jgi:hypothetical protein
MRTTVELPPDLMRAAKARSAESGESLKALLTRAVAAELGTSAVRRGSSARVSLPLFGSADGARVQVTNEALERALAGDDAAHAGQASKSPRRGRARAR